MENAELVLIPGPEMGHIVAEVELAKQLVAQDPRITVSILVPKLPVPDDKLDAYIHSIDAELSRDGGERIAVVGLPQLDNLPPDWSSRNFLLLVDLLMDLYRPIVKRVVEQRQRRTAGIVFDMFCTRMIDVAKELGVPSYVFFTSGANMLSMMFQVESLAVDLPSVYGGMSPDSTPVQVPGYRNPVPLKVWPGIFLMSRLSAFFIRYATVYRETNGILVNTFMELESDVLLSLSENKQIPPVYSIGPMLHHVRSKDDNNPKLLRLSQDPVLSWLDGQPVGSVVFLCFGSKGGFGKEQVQQIATGIEQSGHRFLWSLRRNPNHEKGARVPTEYQDYSEVVPEGFLERTAGIGKMTGWVPQTEVLAHPAIGAFVSHCGWNSTLESLWFGVPIVAWPMYAEQQLNAFLLVKELGIAVDLRMDYMFNLAEGEGNVMVTAAEVEAGIRRTMDEEEGAAVRKKVKEMSEVARKALEVGGSSCKSFGRFIEDVIKNIS